jgi:hypothetical protein
VDRPTPHSPPMHVISTGVGRRLFPPSLQAKVSAHAVEKSLFDRPREPRSNVAIQSPKLWEFTTSSALNLPVFSGFQTLSSSAQFRSRPFVLSATYSFFLRRCLSLFTLPIFCFQHLMDSFLQNRGVGVATPKKSKMNRVKGCQQAATLRAS